MNKRTLTGLVLVFVILLLVACGSEEAEEIREEVVVTEIVEKEIIVEAEAEQPPEEGVESEGSERAAAPMPAPPSLDKDVGTGSVVTADEAASAADSDDRVAMVAPLPTTIAPSRADATPLPDAELTLDHNNRLTAGEVDDNQQWDDYLLYLRDYRGERILPIDVSHRHRIDVVDTQGQPVLAAYITIAADNRPIQTLRTHSDGSAYFFPRALPAADQFDQYEVMVTPAIYSSFADFFVLDASGAQREWRVELPVEVVGGSAENTTQLDVLFLIDATGSMADEIRQLKDNIHVIAAEIDALPSQPDVRYGMVTYRDRYDTYVTQVSDFTPDVTAFAAELAQVSADGGGDYPEDLNQALTDALHSTEWRVEDTVSLIFLVADAPPHLDYEQTRSYVDELVVANERGIKIYPIASSGLDEQGEYIFRQLAQMTGARFVFLTYGSGGAGTTGTETSFEVNDYTVSALDDLVVRIVEEELAPTISD